MPTSLSLYASPTNCTFHCNDLIAKIYLFIANNAFLNYVIGLRPLIGNFWIMTFTRRCFHSALGNGCHGKVKQRTPSHYPWVIPVRECLVQVIIDTAFLQSWWAIRAPKGVLHLCPLIGVFYPLPQRDPNGAIDQILFDFSKHVSPTPANGRPNILSSNIQGETKLLQKRLKLKGFKCTA